MNIRREAYKTLLRINYEGAYSNLEVKSILRDATIKDEDRRLYLSLVYGTLQNQMGIDHLIKQQIGRPLQKIQTEVLMILRIAYYQLYFLDRIPDYAIVNEAVKQTQKIKPKAKGFVNGVLRNQLRKIEQEGRAWEFLDIKDPLKKISIENSLPFWIVEKFFDVFDKEAENIVKLMNKKPPFTIRSNSFKIGSKALQNEFMQANVLANAGEFTDVALNLEQLEAFHHQIENTEFFKNGLFSIQDQGAMLAVEALGAQENDVILDMCAAPGGKTTYLSQIMNNSGTIIARDIYPNRLKLIENDADRLGCKNIRVEEKDGCLYDANDRQRFDRILLDAPCSGLGVIRRKPEIRYQITENKIIDLIEIQNKLLQNAQKYLKKGGYLLYSTCTINEDENEKQIENFLKQYKNMQIIPFKGIDFHYTNPLMDGCDGFFMCLLKKSENQ
ncbi:16S rRNA (cytosine(967)-C(5))-methyltransferase RsmB [Eubacteriaceae bacterium ES2]|nr:16S rRNA (cytosine(967)-C(5))-methyltransferase RsmB [Eubacteriaceae bacterium ES2]